jgi:hypothetical protein
MPTQKQQEQALVTGIPREFAYRAMFVASIIEDGVGADLSAALDEHGEMAESMRAAMLVLLVRDLALAGVARDDVRLLVQEVYDAAEDTLDAASR